MRYQHNPNGAAAGILTDACLITFLPEGILE
jgi:hypothetical protein